MPCTTNVLQATAGATGGSFTNDFADIGSNVVVRSFDQASTNYVETGGATNLPARYYRVRLVP